MAQTARTEAEKATDNVTDNAAELGKRAADKAQDTARSGLQIVQRAADAGGEIERAVVRRSAEGTAELGQALTELLNEQTQHNVEIFKALTGTVDWNEVARIQGDFLRASLERGARLTQRYLEVTQAVFVTAVSTASDQAKKAA